MEITAIEYHNEQGDLLFTEPVPFRSLYRIGQDLVYNYVNYLVVNVKFQNGKETVVIRPARAGDTQRYLYGTKDINYQIAKILEFEGFAGASKPFEMAFRERKITNGT